MNLLEKLTIFLLMPGLLAANEGGMISIEVVEDPTFFELYHNQIYVVIIVLFFGLFFWRRFIQRKSSV